MTPIHVYAVVRTPSDDFVTVTGIDGENLTCHSVDGVGLLAGHREDGPRFTMQEEVLRHHQVIVDITKHAPALPVRYGTVFEDEAEIHEALRAKRDALSRDLDYLAGKCEFGITVLWDLANNDDEAGDLTRDSAGLTGAAYMQQRLSEYRHERELNERAEKIRDDLESALSPVTIMWDTRVLPKAHVPVRASYLVADEEVDAFASIAARFAEEHPDLDVHVVGPWPPYSFVSSAGSGGGA